MESVQASQNNPLLAARELLAYYRGRERVKHPVDRTDKLRLRGKIASEGDLKVADNALQHIFVGQPAYPAFFCGKDINWSSRPVKDNEWVWQLNRMTFWDAMARAYWHTGEEKYAREWAFQLLRTFELAKLNGLQEAFSEDYLQTIEKMCEVPMKLAFPDGTTPQFGDAWRGKPGQYYDQLYKWARLFERDDFQYVATEGKEGKKPGATAFALSESGLYSLRSGWNKEAICL